MKAPWTQEQCDRLNAFQNSRQFHPFTCGGNRCDDAHKAYQAEHGGDFGQLVATADGWVCPVPGCGYRQDWAHDEMASDAMASVIEHQKQFFGQRESK